jgi:hypothetical protein
MGQHLIGLFAKAHGRQVARPFAQRSSSCSASILAAGPITSAGGRPSACSGATPVNCARLSLACTTTPCASSASKKPCGWIAPGVRIGSCSQLVMSIAVVAMACDIA